MPPREKTGLILMNVGTPSSCEPVDVGRYLREFLMDPYVIDIPWALRAVLVRGIIVPRRKVKSAALYRKVWMSEGSPLYVFSRRLTTKIQAALGETYSVHLAMRYGDPCLKKALADCKAAGVSRLILFPMYPQYSLAATETALEQFRLLAKQILPGVPIESIPPFFDRPEYLDAVAEVSQSYLTGADRVIFSFHGIPERHIRKTDSTGHCLQGDCCDKPPSGRCYRAQSFETARQLAKRLGLEQYEVAFQSRLGRTPWIQPFTDKLYEKLPAQGIRRVAVLAPSFVADCLETLEEIQIRGQESFVASGGRSLTLVPSLNDSAPWVNAIGALLKTAQSV